MKTEEINTYVFIDASNIKNACRNSCKFDLDFIKLGDYLNRKYNIKSMKYYEGLSIGDNIKKQFFNKLRESGYNVCTLECKEYNNFAKYSKYKCSRCGEENWIEVAPATHKLKSNVDVYLASDMVELAATSDDDIHIILVSCDGDYVEAIKSIFRVNNKVRVTVLATPSTRSNNCFSVRLKRLKREINDGRYNISNILDIKSRVKR